MDLHRRKGIFQPFKLHFDEDGADSWHSYDQVRLALGKGQGGGSCHLR